LYIQHSAVPKRSNGW